MIFSGDFFQFQSSAGDKPRPLALAIDAAALHGTGSTKFQSSAGDKPRPLLDHLADRFNLTAVSILGRGQAPAAPHSSPNNLSKHGVFQSSAGDKPRPLVLRRRFR